jgi:hypothetical protein
MEDAKQRMKVQIWGEGEMERWRDEGERRGRKGKQD